MQKVKLGDLSPQEKKLLNLAQEKSKKTFSANGTMIGVAILGQSGRIYTGAAVSWEKYVGSTCAERMALDQLAINTGEVPILAVVTGHTGKNPTSTIITPCGKCRQMFHDYISLLGRKDLDFVLSSWDQKNIVRTRLSKLLPLSYTHEAPMSGCI